MSPHFRCLQVFLMLACLGGLMGCAQLDSVSPTSWLLAKAKGTQTPAKLVAIWTGAVLHPSDRPSVRGFGGQLTFYRPESEKPVRVDGSLIVYAFGEENRDSPGAKPDRKYVFTREQFARHYHESKLGHTYSIWIPWDEVGGPKKHVSLVARFNPADGPTIFGEHTKMILSGRPGHESGDRVHSKQITKGQLPRADSIRAVSHEATLPADATQENRDLRRPMVTTTIPIRPQFGRPTPVAQMRSERLTRRERLRRATLPSRGTPEGTQTVPTPTASLPANPGPQPTGPTSTHSAPAGSPVRAWPGARPAYDRGP